MTDIEKKMVADAINASASTASRLIYEFACRFSLREQYVPVEELAQIVQMEVINTFSDRMKR